MRGLSVPARPLPGRVHLRRGIREHLGRPTAPGDPAVAVLRRRDRRQQRRCRRSAAPARPAGPEAVRSARRTANSRRPTPASSARAGARTPRRGPSDGMSLALVVVLAHADADAQGQPSAGEVVERQRPAWRAVCRVRAVRARSGSRWRAGCARSPAAAAASARQRIIIRSRPMRSSVPRLEKPRSVGAPANSSERLAVHARDRVGKADADLHLLLLTPAGGMERRTLENAPGVGSASCCSREPRGAARADATTAGRPRVLPVTFALHAGSLWTVVDNKPKRGRRAGARALAARAARGRAHRRPLRRRLDAAGVGAGAR